MLHVDKKLLAMRHLGYQYFTDSKRTKINAVHYDSKVFDVKHSSEK